MEFSKYKASAVGRLFLHNNRSSDDGVTHSNEEIDNERTIYNYHFKKGTAKDVTNRVNELVPIHNRNRTELGEMIVTLPEDVKPEDERKFFQSVYEFFCNDFGEENIINAVVHKDETTPHLHLDFVPVKREEIEFQKSSRQKILTEWKERNPDKIPERLCCRDLINRNYLKVLHPRLKMHTEKELGYEVSILNGATENGNKSIAQLKNESLKAEIEKSKKQLEYLHEDIQKIQRIAERWGISSNDISLLPLVSKIDSLERKNAILREIIARNDFSYSREDMEQLRETNYETAKSSQLNIYDNSLVNADIDKNAVVVVELPANKKSPQQKLIAGDDDLYRQSRLASTSSAPIVTRQSRTNNRVYIFFKTETEKQTMESFYLFEQQLKSISDLRNRKLYMDRLESDTYDFARSVLQRMDCETLYYTGKTREENSQKQLEKNISQ